jgi:hypothetical protein
MADFATNPYLQMPQQEAPDWKQVLGNALLGVGAGISQADGSGRGWAAGIGPGLMYGNQMLGQQQQNAEQQAMKRWQLGMMVQDWQSKQEERREKTAMAKAKEARDAGLGSQIGALMGLSAPQPGPQMGPNFGSAIAGIESGGKYDALGPETGKGRAYGKYQVMDFNIGPWTAEVLGKPMTPQEFVANPQAQDAVFRAKFGQLAQKHGPEGAARAWFAGEGGMNNPNAADVNGMTVAKYAQKFNAGMGGPMVAQAGGPPAQGDAIAGQGDAPTPQSAIASLPAEVRTAIGLMAQRDPEKALQMTVQAIQNQKKEDVWTPLSPESAKMFNLDPAKSWQMNKVTRKIEPVGGAQTVVNIDQKAEAEFGKEMGKMDAKRFGAIIEAEGTMNDMASKLGFALDQFKQTYTGPGAEAANQLNRILGAAGFEEAGKKANAADAAQAVVSQMKPHMRAAGSGASSDKDMDMFAKALPSLMNLPDGNERIVTFFQKMADRASKIRELAQEHSEGGKVPLTRTQFDAEVKKLGPLFSEDDKKLLEGVSKAAPKKTDRPPISSFGRDDPAPSMTPAQRPPLSSFGR